MLSKTSPVVPSPLANTKSSYVYWKTVTQKNSCTILSIIRFFHLQLLIKQISNWEHGTLKG